MIKGFFPINIVANHVTSSELSYIKNKADPDSIEMKNIKLPEYINLSVSPLKKEEKIGNFTNLIIMINENFI